MIDLDFKVIKFIYNFDETIKIGHMSRILNIPHSTLGSCIKRLEKEGYVIYQRYKSVILSNRGKDLAIELNRHARLLELLFYNELGLTAKEAYDESEKFNLLLSCDTVKKICDKYDHPSKCPCGDLILNSISCYCEKKN